MLQEIASNRNILNIGPKTKTIKQTKPWKKTKLKTIIMKKNKTHIIFHL